jgi:hypothetical protein
LQNCNESHRNRSLERSSKKTALAVPLTDSGGASVASGQQCSGTSVPEKMFVAHPLLNDRHLLAHCQIMGSDSESLFEFSDRFLILLPKRVEPRKDDNDDDVIDHDLVLLGG